MSEQDVFEIVDNIFTNPTDAGSRRKLANPEFSSELVITGYKYALEQYYSRLEQAFDDKAKLLITYGCSLISLICFTSLWRSLSTSISSIDEIFDVIDTRGFVICVEFCKAEKSFMALKVLFSFLSIIEKLGSIGKCFRSMEHMFEIHQPIMSFFEEMGLTKNESSSSEEIQDLVEKCVDIYMRCLTLLFSDSSFENVDENFMFKYLLVCKGLFNDSLTNDTCQSVFIHLFTGIPSCVSTIQYYTESKRTKQTETRMDVLKDVVVGICDNLQNKKAFIRKGITLLYAVVSSYLNGIEHQKDMILKSLTHAITRMLLMPRKGEVVQQMLNKSVELFLLIPFQDTSIDNVLILKSASPDYLNATAKTFLLSFLINNNEKKSKHIETVIKQIRYCDSVLMSDVSDSISIYQNILQNTLSALFKTKSTQIFTDVQVVLWKEMFDISNNDISREFCIDMIAILFNNNAGSQLFYLEYLKDMICVVSNNLFLSPTELRISNSTQGESVEWMVVEKILRPLLCKMEIKDYKQITTFTDILSDEGIAQLAILPYSLKVNELRKCITQIVNKLKDRSDDAFSIALVTVLKNVLQYGKMTVDSVKKIIAIVLTSKIQYTVSERYLEEAILCFRSIVTVSDIGSDLSYLIETLNSLKQFCWARSDRIKICICSLVESMSKNNLSTEFVQTLKQFFKLALSSDNVSVQIIIQKSLLAIYLTKPEFKDIVSDCLRPEYFEFIEQMLGSISEDGKIRAFSKLTENQMMDLQNVKYEQSMNKKKSIVAYQSDVQKLKSNIKTIQTVSVVDQLAEVNKSLNDLLTSKDKDPFLLQQLNFQIQELNNVSNKLLNK